MDRISVKRQTNTNKMKVPLPFIVKSETTKFNRQ